MAGSSDDALRGVKFNTASLETPAKEGGKVRRWLGSFRRSHKKEPEPIAPAPAKPAPAPFVIAEPEHESISFIKSLPNDRAREDARTALSRAFGDRVPTLEEAKEALVCDAGGMEGEVAERRAVLFSFSFWSKTEFMLRGDELKAPETINVFFYRMDLFSKMMMVLKRDGEERGLRSKCEDRMGMLQAMEKVLFAMPRAERIDGFVLMAGIAMKMSETLCTKEVCVRMKGVLGIMAGEEADKLAMLRDMHGKIMKCGVRPSGADMNSGVPRAEKEEAGRWIASRPRGGAMEAAALAWERKKPKSFLDFMRLLEEGAADTENRRLYVLEEVVGEWAGGARKAYRPAEEGGRTDIAWNIGYFCVEEIKAVADSAKGMGDEEGVRLAILDTMLWVARRMPPGRRMEAPGLVRMAVKKLAEGDEGMGMGAKPSAWIASGWMYELRQYMSEPDAETAHRRLLWVPMDPMKVVDYMEPAKGQEPPTAKP
ncbi:MAG: hypothetical protein PHQ80_01485 [Candidatus ainarchaeum sp.]|nr:hypothetical protein [Candidatus ainarchaeum sp.]MDD5095894.1 hypothetical protein [Candidatus ainarchaeum sp.]